MLPRMYGVPAQWMQLLATTMDSSGSNSGSHTTKQAAGAAQQQQAGSGAPSQSRDGDTPAPGLVPIPYWLPDQGWSAMVAAGTWLSPGPAPAGV
jgi:hypothetical protein